MATYIALMRGINVGRTWVKMERLKELFVSLGFADVKTYVQSGNVVFRAPGAMPLALSKRIRTALLNKLKIDVFVLVKTKNDFEKVWDGNPFLGKKNVNPLHLHVTFLAAVPDKPALQRLQELDAGPDRYAIRDTEVYLHCPGGYGKSKLTNNRLESLLATEATTRNWKTVSQLHQLSGEHFGS